MFERPPYDTKCSGCNTYPTWTNHPASTRCSWCVKYLCSEHAEQPFGPRSSVRACKDCAEGVERSTLRVAAGFAMLRIPTYVADVWIARYSSTTFARYDHPESLL